APPLLGRPAAGIEFPYPSRPTAGALWRTWISYQFSLSGTRFSACAHAQRVHTGCQRRSVRQALQSRGLCEALKRATAFALLEISANALLLGTILPLTLSFLLI